jgi:putative flippase GtrA
MSRLSGEFVRFSVVGAIGFIVDATVLHVVAVIYNGDPYLSRIVSYFFAATTTWLLNRNFTFAGHGGGPLGVEWAQYLTANAIGGCLNYCVYAILVAFCVVPKSHLFLGIAAGSAAGLAFNFCISKRLVFAERI